MIVIYALRCPVSGGIRYIGKSSNPQKRLKYHIMQARAGNICHCGGWIRILLSNGLKPTLEIVKEVAESECWIKAEKEAIAEHRAKGCRLTNMTDGGEGAACTDPEILARKNAAIRVAHARPDVAEKNSANAKRNWANAEFRQRHAAAMELVNSDPAVRAKKAAASKRMWSDPKHREKMSDVHKAINQNQEFKSARIEAAVRGNKVPGVSERRSRSAKEASNRPDVMAKNVAAQKQLWQCPEYRKRQSDARLRSWANRKSSA
jgi:hypothetical protein